MARLGIVAVGLAVVAAFAAGSASVRAQPVASITMPEPGTTGQRTEQLYAGCNNMSLTFPDGTASERVAQAVSPTGALEAVWRYDANQRRFEGYSPAAAQASDLLTVNFLDAVWLCFAEAAAPTPIPPPAAGALVPPSTSAFPSVEEAMARHSIKVKAGDSPALIIEAYGEPSSDEMLDNFDPPVMRLMRYVHLGLEFLFNRERLCHIDITGPFTGEVFGLRIGDPIGRAVAIYGNEYDTFDTVLMDIGSVRAYEWKSHLPDWFFYDQGGTIVAIGMHNAQIYGTWIPKSR